MIVKTWYQKLEVPGYIASTVRKLRGKNADTQLNFSFIPCYGAAHIQGGLSYPTCAIV